MKKLILLTFFPVWLLAQEPTLVSESSMISTTATAEVESNDWLKNYDDALSDAKKEKRNILIYFTGSDWCPPCKMLKKDFFDTEAFETIAQNYTLLYIDVPRDRTLLSPEQMEHNSKLLHKINKKGVFPLLVILDEKGSKIDEYSGYSMNGDVQSHLKLLEKHKE